MLAGLHELYFWSTICWMNILIASLLKKILRMRNSINLCKNCCVLWFIWMCHLKVHLKRLCLFSEAQHTSAVFPTLPLGHKQLASQWMHSGDKSSYLLLISKGRCVVLHHSAVILSCTFPFSHAIWQHASMQLVQQLLSQEPEVSSRLTGFKDTFLKAKALNIHVKCTSVWKKRWVI